MRADDEQNLFQQITGSFDEPAFLRRAKNTEAAWQYLTERVQRKRDDWLRMPMIHLGRVFMLAANRSLEQFVCPADVSLLQSQHEELNPQLRRKTSPATSDGQIRNELTRLTSSYERFNSRWLKYIETIDYTYVNSLRDGYNKYYVLEKECALMSSRTATAGFRELPMAGPADVLNLYPLLDVPQLIVAQ